MAQHYADRPEHAGIGTGVAAKLPFAINWTSAIGTGFIATAVNSLLLYLLPQMMGMPPVDMGKLLGTMVAPQGGAGALWMGWIWHFANGIVFTLIYAGVLLWQRQQSTWLTGLWFGVVLWIVAGIMMPIMLDMHPLVRSGMMKNPGLFMVGMGMMGLMLSLVTHLVYGVIAGATYKHSSVAGVPSQAR